MSSVGAVVAADIRGNHGGNGAATTDALPVNRPSVRKRHWQLDAQLAVSAARRSYSPESACCTTVGKSRRATHRGCALRGFLNTLKYVGRSPAAGAYAQRRGVPAPQVCVVITVRVFGHTFLWLYRKAVRNDRPPSGSACILGATC